ncbi:MAG TPA: hypothetical protein VMQ59_05350, partial [Acidimicrobiales bacterium]|nr:hypothetical protein [Acidimicrobiales bacterium]
MRFKGEVGPVPGVSLLCPPEQPLDLLDQSTGIFDRRRAGARAGLAGFSGSGMSGARFFRAGRLGGGFLGGPGFLAVFPP